MRRALAYAQLLRLPNVFTALADIGLGALATGALPEHAGPFGLLLGASGCLYCAGMVWNDYFDVEQDRRERPFRPIPSGRVSPPAGARLGLALLAAGIGCAVLADRSDEGFRGYSTLLAGLLTGAILLYDGWLKRTAAGPVAMGACRALNVLLGLSVFPGGADRWVLPLALVVGIYIAGVTWFARTEARVSNQGALAGAAGVMLAGALLALALPAFRTPALGEDGAEVVPAVVRWGHVAFPYLLAVFIGYVGAAVSRAVARPLPQRVQAAVRRAILGLVALDAVLATGLAGPVGLVLMLLLVPALYLGRWVYST